jgi:hypothetical protein
MMKPAFWMVVCVGCSLSVTAQAQTVGRGGSFNPSGSLGSRGTAGGARGVRSRAVNPNFNPPGSQSLFQRLNPPGSNSPALNLNPNGSVFRPRTGNGSDQPSTASPNVIRRKAYRSQLVPSLAQLELMPRHSLCDWVRSSARQLEAELARFENGSDWKTVLQLDQVREILSTQLRPTLTIEDRQQLTATLDRFNKLATNTQYDAVTQLPGFTPLHRSLAQLLSADATSSRSPAAQQNEATGVE